MGLQKIGMVSSLVCLLWPSFFGCLRADLVECDAKTVSGSCHNGDCCTVPQRGGSLLQMGRSKNKEDTIAFNGKESDEAGKHKPLTSGAGRSIVTGSFDDRENPVPEKQSWASQPDTHYESALRAFTSLISNTLSGNHFSPMPALLQHGSLAGDDEASDGKEFEEAAQKRNMQSAGGKSIATRSLNDGEKIAAEMPYAKFTSYERLKTQTESVLFAFQAMFHSVKNILGGYMSMAMPARLQQWHMLVRIADAVIIITIVLAVCIILSSLLVIHQINKNVEVSQLPLPSWNTGAQFSKPRESFTPTTPIGSPMTQRTMTNRPTSRRASEGPYERLRSPSVIHTGTGAAQCLCPCLVVPSGNECFLAVPTLKSVGISSNNSVCFDVKDTHGCTVLVMEVSDVNWRNVGDHSQMKPAIVLRQAGSKQAHRSEPPPLLACCKAGRVVEGERCMFIYDNQNAFFAYMKRDASKGCYLLTSARMGLQLMFFGNFEEHAVSVVNEIDEQKATLLATTEPAEMSFDTQKSFIKVRAGSGVDVGLILCGLTSIGLMERE